MSIDTRTRASGITRAGSSFELLLDWRPYVSGVGRAVAGVDDGLRISDTGTCIRVREGRERDKSHVAITPYCRVWIVLYVDYPELQLRDQGGGA
jgi:hypothetical protein